MKQSKIYKIDELEVGQIVDAPDGYYQVEKCKKGGKYYGFLDVHPDDAGIDENTDVKVVSDIEVYGRLCTQLCCEMNQEAKDRQ